MSTAGTRQVDKSKFVWATEPKNYTGAASTSDIVSLKNYNHLTILIQTGAWAGGTAAVTLSQCTDVAAAGAKALAFDVMFTNATAVTSDALVKTTVTSNTFALDTANALYIIEVDATTLDLANNFDCVRLDVASPSSNADIYGAVFILGNVARYGGNYATNPSAIID